MTNPFSIRMLLPLLSTSNGRQISGRDSGSRHADAEAPGYPTRPRRAGGQNGRNSVAVGTHLALRRAVAFRGEKNLGRPTERCVLGRVGGLAAGLHPGSSTESSSLARLPLREEPVR